MSHTALVIVTGPAADNATPGAPAPGFHLADPDLPQLRVTDLAASRGDGVFESISVIDGHPHALEAHLNRLAQSAAILDLPRPGLPVWEAAILRVVEELDPTREASLRAVYSRGIEGGSTPTGWVYGAPSPDYSAVRSAGVGVVLLDRGYRHDIQHTAPWLLAGAKTLSYAVNRAALREANRRGADDVIFVSADGYILEGATSSVLFMVAGRLLTPGTAETTGIGILEGTTQGDVFRWAEENNLSPTTVMATPDDLRGSDAAWLVSSSRHAVPIRSIDGQPHPLDAGITSAINSYLAGRTS
ncbi:MAG: 4-amino-4-deoxychorismate lyase [Glaciihabitans sp.]|nr:4-amino-4-deoxychorismate lyase [Glaciihabitans sp.]